MEGSAVSSDRFVIFGFAGSLRRASFNRGLLRAAATVLPPGVELETFDLSPLPLYNEDLLSAMPEPVKQFKARMSAADALLIVTPEYNYGIPGVLKNAIDWSSRPPRESSIMNKPTGIMGCSNGRFASVRAQHALRQTLLGTVTPVLHTHQVLVGDGPKKFDADGNLTDTETLEYVKKHLVALVDWARRQRL
jgi:chromate reductase